MLPASGSRAQVGKANQILINRGLQVEGLVATYDTFHLSTYSNANYTAVIWLWDSPRSYDSMSQLGAAPGFPWARWVSSEGDMPPLGGESAYLGQLVNLQLADEWNLNDAATRTRAVNWFIAVRTNWPSTILSANNWGGQISDGNLIDFITRAQPDMICFDAYPWKSVYDAGAPGHIGPPIAGPPTDWYGNLRTYRDISRAFNIPFGSYVQTFHAVEEYGSYNVYRNPSPSELRLNHFGALAFNSKMLIDFLYNNGSSSLFDPPGGDSNPNALYYEKADCALRARNFGQALVRLKPIDEATAQWTTSVLFVRGKDAGGALNPIPVNFYAGAAGTNANTDWVADRNDPYLRGWVVTNTGTKNNGQPGDVIIAWFKPLDESFDGPGYTNEVYFMVVNGLTATNGTAADCSQEIRLNFVNSFTAVELLNPATGVAEGQVLPVVSTRRQLVLNLNGGDAALFKISDGAPFVGVPLTNPPSPLLLYEPFDYPGTGSPVSSNTPANWAYGGSGANDLNVAPGSLLWPGLAASAGNSVTNGGVGLGVRRLLGINLGSGVVYFSALFRINDLGYGAWNGAASQAGALTATDNSGFRLQVMVKSNSPSGYGIGVQKGGTGSTPTFDTTERRAGETVLLVGKYDFTAMPNTVSLWINPALATFGAATEPTTGLLAQSSGTDGFVIDRFNIRQNTAASVPAAMQWDELRVGLSWASVTPLSSEAPTLLTGLTRLTNAAFQFAYINASGQAGTVYTSTNLINWTLSGTATQITAGRYQFTDPEAANYPRRFYKLRSP
jgi:hypothetical protein